jgi:hypothetical protein
MKNRNGTLGGSDFYSGHVEVIKGSAFLNLRSKGQSEIQTAVRDSSERFIRQTSFRKSSMCELL